jgi:heme oxygenase
MNTKDSALHELRIATRSAHDELEKHLIIARPDAGREEYLAYVAAFLGWLRPFEAKLWDAPWPQALHAEARAVKGDWIEADLRSAGYDDAAIAAIPLSPFKPELRSMADRYGLAYVLEGAQLGTQVLRKTLGPSLAPWSPRWLESYGADTSAYWRGFIQCAEEALRTPEERQAAAHAARAAFTGLTAWFRSRSIA